MSAAPASTLVDLICSACGLTDTADEPRNVCRDCGKVLFARYDLDRARDSMRPENLRAREPTLWRYMELLPLRNGAARVSLGEGFTPLLSLPRLARTLGMASLLLKDESLNPTASFKARGMAVAVSRARELGLRRLAAPSAGNAGAALAVYAARAGLRAWTVMPRDTPRVPLIEARLAGAHVHLIDGLIHDAGRVVRRHGDWFDMSTLREPYRVEGKKTMGFEIVEQMGGRLPDAIVYPAGGGTGLIGMAKSFDEMQSMGWIGIERPRMYVVQSAGCAPIVRAYESGAETAVFWRDASTIASGLRVPAALGDYLMLRTLRSTGGGALAVSDDAIRRATDLAAGREGIWLSPEGAATVAAAGLLRDCDALRRDETVVLFNTGAGMLYPDLQPLPSAEVHPDALVIPGLDIDTDA
ncbi:MAG: threonine synthase [Chloroflexi bacterium]|nr:threonine synthase [Chloroflexota bacterium]